MGIEQVKKLKLHLEREIRDRLAEFKRDTGVTPTRCDIHVIESAVAEGGTYTHIGGVTLDLEIL